MQPCVLINGNGITKLKDDRLLCLIDDKNSLQANDQYDDQENDYAVYYASRHRITLPLGLCLWRTEDLNHPGP